MSDTTSPPPLPPPGLPTPLPPAGSGAGSKTPPGGSKSSLALMLSLALLLLGANAMLSFLDDTLRVWMDVTALSNLRVLLFGAALITSVILYAAMGFNRSIPKRFFLPLAISLPVVLLAPLALMIFWFEGAEISVWLINLLPLGLVLWCWRWAAGGWRWRWPVITESQLASRPFSWGHLAAYTAASAVIIPAVLALYFMWCSVHAVQSMTAGFMSLGWRGFTAHAAEYRDNSGNQVHLVPMMHVAQGSFFNSVVQGFPTNSVILLEGVSDEQNKLKYKVTYKRVADKLGLEEQHEAFNPTHGELRVADVDVSDFSERTIAMLNVAMQYHAEGFSPQWLDKVMQFGSDMAVIKGLKEDLLEKRNRHVLQVLKSELNTFDVAVIPWGAAHMPGIAAELERKGFKKEKSTDYEVVRWLK